MPAVAASAGSTVLFERRCLQSRKCLGESSCPREPLVWNSRQIRQLKDAMRQQPAGPGPPRPRRYHAIVNLGLHHDVSYLVIWTSAAPAKSREDQDGKRTIRRPAS